MEFLAAAFAEAVFFGAEISDGAEFLAALLAPVELAASFTTAPFTARVFSAGGGACVCAERRASPDEILKFYRATFVSCTSLGAGCVRLDNKIGNRMSFGAWAWLGMTT